MNDMNLQKFLSLIKRSVAWIALGLVAGLIIMMLASLTIIPKQYTSSIQLYVTAYSSEQAANTTSVQSSEITAAEKLANTCSVILQNQDILQVVVNKLNQQTTVKYVKGSLTIKVVSGTQILEITSTTNNAQLSADICNTLAEIAPAELKSVMNGGYAKAVGNAAVPNSASSPNVLKNSLVGAFMGLVIAVIVVLIIELFDNTIKTADVFKEHFDVPVLGEIPSFIEKKGR